MKKFALFAAVLCTSLIGCAGPEVEAEPLYEDELPDVYAPFSMASDARIVGQVGDVTDIDAVVSRPQVWDDGNYMAVELAAQVNENNAVMLFLSAYQSDDIGVGTYIVDRNDPDAMFTLLGCTGQAIDTYDMYDAPADHFIVDVTDNEENSDLSLDVSATWTSREVGVSDTIAFGTVTLHR